MLKFAICEKSTTDRHILSSEICRILGVECTEVYEFETGHELLLSLKKGLIIDVVFLDSTDYDSRAIEVGHELNLHFPDIAVVYTTQSFFENVYETQHEYLLLKPIHPAMLRRALDKICARYTRNALTIKEKGTTSVVSSDTILYCERRNRRTCIITGSNERMCSLSIKSLGESLGNNFVITHNSFIVNLSHVAKLNNDSLELDDGTVIPVSRSKAVVVRAKVLKHLFKN